MTSRMESTSTDKRQDSDDQPDWSVLELGSPGELIGCQANHVISKSHPIWKTPGPVVYPQPDLDPPVFCRMKSSKVSGEKKGDQHARDSFNFVVKRLLGSVHPADINERSAYLMDIRYQS